MKNQLSSLNFHGTPSGMVRRSYHLKRVSWLLRRNRVVALLGARQVGKTTLARALVKARRGPATFFDLESSADLQRLADPLFVLENLKGLVVLDEVQHRPELFPTLRVLADRPRGPRFLVLGSASPKLLRQTSESLAGRIAFHELPPLQLEEVGIRRANQLWLQGGFPRSFAATSMEESLQWRRDFIRTFLQHDLPQLGIQVPAASLGRFWSMLAHVHAQTLNLSELGRSMGVTDTAIRHYLDILSQTFMVRALAPWHENISKRQVKAPKVYLRDSGLLHSLLDIRSHQQLEVHSKVGASWEGHCLEAVVHRLKARPEECYFWATHQGAELDLLVVRGAERRGFEIKRSSSAGITNSMKIALEDLKLDSLDVIYAGKETYPLSERVRAVPLSRVLQDIAP
jgi:predicted AAA+ superfamily ATPase